MKSVLTIAGSDCSGGAGIQGDIKTITAHKLYAMSVITGLTAQNTTGIYGIESVTPEFVEKQLECIFRDIPPDAVKIGMVSNSRTVFVLSEQIEKYRPKHIVIDPVMISTSGTPLLQPETIETLSDLLFPLGTLITPNIPEAEVICGFSIRTKKDMMSAAHALYQKAKCPILIKGGHLTGSADDLLLDNLNYHWYTSERIPTVNTHGTGCALSSAIACNLANGHDLPGSVQLAKSYLIKAIRSSYHLGSGNGPLNHMCLL